MTWTALLALKPLAACKSRLGDDLGMAQRACLVLEMLERARAVLVAESRIERLVLISNETAIHWPHERRVDQGRGLNGELAAAKNEIEGNILVIHPDLPLLEQADVAALLDAAETCGVAIAPDIDDRGTNAIAMTGACRIPPYFGEDSFARHRTVAGSAAAAVRRTGLALDCDGMAQLRFAVANGFETEVFG